MNVAGGGGGAVAPNTRSALQAGASRCSWGVVGGCRVADKFPQMRCLLSRVHWLVHWADCML